MSSDARCHPMDLLKRFPGAEAERRTLGIVCAASAWNMTDFIAHETLAAESERDRGPQVLRCFALHPQLPEAMEREAFPSDQPISFSELLAHMERLAEENRLDAIGETGFDLYNSAFRNTEAIQDELFIAHLELALKQELPLVLHIRRAMHKVFLHTKALKKLPALIFHSYPGTVTEGESLLRRGINAYFSFGTPIVLGRKAALQACAMLPGDRLLLETDAPYQSLQGALCSHWGDLPLILKTAASLRAAAGNSGPDPETLESLVDRNFYQAYGLSG